VRQEGLFRLQYRIVDVLAGAAPHPVLATHAGAPFRIWPSKDFPGLTASTECVASAHAGRLTDAPAAG
jgi:hypothetical protein